MLQGLLGIFSGLITPVQTAVNTRLGRSIGSPLRASLVSFSVGLIAMLTLTLLLGPYPLIPATAANGPWWMWFAGVFGVTFLTGNVLLLPKLGSLKTVIMPVTGQIVMGLLIDAFGWFGTTAQPTFPAAHRRCGDHAGRLPDCRRRTESAIDGCHRSPGWRFGKFRRFRKIRN